MLSDVYSAEKQPARALGKLANNASDTEHVQALSDHLEETHGQIERIDKVVQKAGLKV